MQVKDALVFQEMEAAGGKHAGKQLETKAEDDGVEEEETFSMGFPMQFIYTKTINQKSHTHPEKWTTTSRELDSAKPTRFLKIKKIQRNF